jgi:hypothetical protein
MNNWKKTQAEYDKIAATRLNKLEGGISLYVALGGYPSITLRNKMNRMGLKGPHVNAALKMVDELGMQRTLERESLGTRFATVEGSKSKPKIWKKKGDD